MTIVSTIELHVLEVVWTKGGVEVEREPRHAHYDPVRADSGRGGLNGALRRYARPAEHNADGYRVEVNRYQIPQSEIHGAAWLRGKKSIPIGPG